MMHRFYILLFTLLLALYGHAQFYSKSVRSTTVNGVTTTITTETTPDGKTKTTKTVTDASGRSKQLPSNTPSSPKSHSSSPNNPGSPSPRLTPSHVSPTGNSRDLSVELEFSKPEAYELEPLLMSYKVYTRFPEVQLQSRLPQMNGFVVKELPHKTQLTLVPTTHNGQQCLVTTCGQSVAFAQKTGKLTIPSVPFEARVKVPLSDPFNPFFQTEDRVVNTPEYSINIKPLPTKPAGFSGAVGHDYSVSAKLLTTKPRANETMSFQVTIHGVGNVDLISPPELKLPSEFKVYDTKITPKTKLTTAGMEGDLIITYQIVASEKGKFTLPPVELIYFDTTDEQYHTTKSENEIAVDIAEGSANSNSAQQRLKNEDIRSIYDGELVASDKSTFWMSLWFAVLYLGLIVLFVLCYKFGTRGCAKILSRPQKGKELTTLLDDAHNKIINGNPTEFYIALTKVIQYGVSHKIKQDNVNVTSDNVESLLNPLSIDNQVIETLRALLADCEYHIYGNPHALESEMRVSYERTREIITSLC